MSIYAKWSAIAGIVLIAMGVTFYVTSEPPRSPTALIPAGIGLGLAICGLVSRTPRSTKIAMHIAILIALVGVIGGFRVFGKWTTMPDLARIAHIALIVICGGLIAAYIHSFVQARKTPDAPADEGGGTQP